MSEVLIYDNGKIMDRRKKEFYVGIFVLLGLWASVYLIVVFGGFKLFNHRDQYAVWAYFSSVSGLKKGAVVEMAGVQIGTVSSISIDKNRMVAKTQLAINKDIPLSEDVIASVKTEGIIGAKYIEVVPGCSEFYLEDGGEIENTESAINIESLVRRYIFNNDTK